MDKEDTRKIIINAYNLRPDDLCLIIILIYVACYYSCNVCKN